MGANVSTVHDVHASIKDGRKSLVMEIQTKRQWKSLFDTMKDSNKLLVIDFTAIWCGPCKSMEPKVKEIAAKYSEVVFARVDVDRLMAVAGEYGANVLPAFVFVKKGEEIDRVVGAKPEELLSKIQTHIV